MRVSRRGRWLAGPSARVLGIGTLAALVALVATPANGGTGTLTTRLAHAVGLRNSPSRDASSYGGAPAVGALFTSSGGKLGSHFCTASVVDSPGGNLLITAAHCLTSASGTIAFVPGYANGSAPYGVWYVTRTFTSQSWASSSDQGDDVAFAEVSGGPGGTPVEDVTGAERLGVGEPAREFVRVIGYPDGSSQPVTCQNWTQPFGDDQIEFDCGGFPDGTSGAPFLTGMSPVSGQGTVTGVIGGYEQGGDTPAVSYSVTFGSGVSALYKTAVSRSQSP